MERRAAVRPLLKREIHTAVSFYAMSLIIVYWGKFVKVGISHGASSGGFCQDAALFAF
jgi:hypothetical protein